MPDTVVVVDCSDPAAPPVVRPPTPAEQAQVDAVQGEAASRISYAATRTVAATAETTDGAPKEVFRFATLEKHHYKADLTISGIDRATFVSRTQEGRFVWKRPTTSAVMVGITVVSNLGEAASTGWAPNAVASGTDIVFTVQGAAGKTVDWELSGSVRVYAPGGLEG